MADKNTTYFKEFRDNWPFAVGIFAVTALRYVIPQSIKYTNQGIENRRDRKFISKYEKIINKS